MEDIDLDLNDPKFLLRKDREANELIKLHRQALYRVNVFWTLWREQYLTALREKWKRHALSTSFPQVGQVVLVHEEELSRNQWRIARIIELPSERTAVIKVSPGNHITKRAIQHLYPLEIEPELNEWQKNSEAKIVPNGKNKKVPIEKTSPPKQTKRIRKQRRDPEFMYEDEIDNLNLATIKARRKSGRYSQAFLNLSSLLSIVVLLLSLIAVVGSKVSPKMNSMAVTSNAVTSPTTVGNVVTELPQNWHRLRGKILSVPPKTYKKIVRSTHSKVKFYATTAKPQKINQNFKKSRDSNNNPKLDIGVLPTSKLTASKPLDKFKILQKERPAKVVLNDNYETSKSLTTEKPIVSNSEMVPYGPNIYNSTIKPLDIEKVSNKETVRREVPKQKEEPLPYQEEQPHLESGKSSKTSSDFYFCKTGSSSLWRVPKQEPFCQEIGKLLQPRKGGRFTLYDKITEPIPVKNAHLCAKKHESISYYTNLFGDKFSDIKLENIHVPATECKDFIKYKSCIEGPLVRTSGGLFSTNKTLNVNFYGAFKGFFFGSQFSEVTNCLLEDTTIYYYPNTLKMFSPLYGLEHCDFSMGECRVENMTLIWYNDCVLKSCDRCYYSKGKTISATYNKRTIHSNDRLLGQSIFLNFSYDPSRMLSCEGTPIRISDQGFAIPEGEFKLMDSTGEFFFRKRREVATTEELAAELSASEYLLLNQMEKILAIQCRHNYYDNNPTKLARRMLKRNDVMAKWLTSDIIRVYTCAAVSAYSVKLRAVEEKCFKFVPVQVKIPQLGWTDAFIDTSLSIISQTAPEADCRVAQVHVIELNGELYEFDSIKNIIKPISSLDIHALPSGIGIEDHKVFALQSFHDLILTNETEIFETAYHSTHVDELVRTSSWKDAVEIKKTFQSTALSSTPHSIPGLIQSYIYGWLGIIHYIWINICAINVTIFAIGLVMYFLCQWEWLNQS